MSAARLYSRSVRAQACWCAAHRLAVVLPRLLHCHHLNGCTTATASIRAAPRPPTLPAVHPEDSSSAAQHRCSGCMWSRHQFIHVLNTGSSVCCCTAAALKLHSTSRLAALHQVSSSWQSFELFLAAQRQALRQHIGSTSAVYGHDLSSASAARTRTSATQTVAVHHCLGSSNASPRLRVRHGSCPVQFCNGYTPRTSRQASDESGWTSVQQPSTSTRASSSAPIHHHLILLLPHSRNALPATYELPFAALSPSPTCIPLPATQ
jgi:hypothetical protein